MGKIKVFILSLLFTIPIGSVFGGILYVLINHYEEVYASMLGPALALLTLILGPYTLSLFFLNYGTIKKQGIYAAFRTHVLKPLTRYIPAMLGIGILFWAWVTFSTGIMKTAIGDSNIDKFIFMIAFLQLVAEAFKISRRTYELDKAIAAAGKPFDAAKFPFQWTAKRLRIVAYSQSPIYLITVWLSMGLIMFLVHEAIDSIFSAYLKSLTYIILMGVIIAGMRTWEKKLEKYGREEQYIPWDSFY